MVEATASFWFGSRPLSLDSSPFPKTLRKRCRIFELRTLLVRQSSVWERPLIRVRHTKGERCFLVDLETLLTVCFGQHCGVAGKRDASRAGLSVSGLALCCRARSQRIRRPLRRRPCKIRMKRVIFNVFSFCFLFFLVFKSLPSPCP